MRVFGVTRIGNSLPGPCGLPSLRCPPPSTRDMEFVSCTCSSRVCSPAAQVPSLASLLVFSRAAPDGISFEF